MISRGAMFAQAARGPVLLIVLGTLFALQQAGVLSFTRSWPLLIIAIGVMKLIERIQVGPAPYTPPSGTPGPGYTGQNYQASGYAQNPTQPPGGAPFGGPPR